MDKDHLEIIKAIAPVMTGVFAIFLALLSGIGWYIKNSITSHNSKLMKEVDFYHRLQDKQRENQYEISREMYEKLFRERIDAYVKINRIRLKYYIKKHEPKDFEVLARVEGRDAEPEDSDFHKMLADDISMIKEIRMVVLENQLYLSKNTWGAFQRLESRISGYLREELVIEEAYEPYDKGYQNGMDYLLESEFFKINEAIKVFLEEIDNEMSALRESIQTSISYS